MYEIFSLRTGLVVQRVKSLVKAHQVVIGLEDVHAWIDGEKFEYRLREEKK